MKALLFLLFGVGVALPRHLQGQSIKAPLLRLRSATLDSSRRQLLVEATIEHHGKPLWYNKPWSMYRGRPGNPGESYAPCMPEVRITLVNDANHQRMTFGPCGLTFVPPAMVGDSIRLRAGDRFAFQLRIPLSALSEALRPDQNYRLQLALDQRAIRWPSSERVGEKRFNGQLFSDDAPITWFR